MSINRMKIYRRFIKLLNKVSPVILAKMRFRKLFHKKLNLDSPQDLNEKILWLSLFSDTSEWSRLADKYAVREYVKDCGLENILVKLYGKWDKVEDINWDILPNSFVLKTNNGSGTVMIVRDKEQIDKIEMSKQLESWLHKDIWGETAEFHYKEIRPCIIAEELLMPTKDELELSSSIIDYKIWCFNGKAYSILVCSNRYHDSIDLSVYDLNWNYHPEYSIFNNGHTERKEQLPIPKNLSEMIRISERLSKGFPEVRVDLYNVNGDIYFGELTFTSLGGTMTYYTSQYLLEMGMQIDLSNVKLK